MLCRMAEYVGPSRPGRFIGPRERSIPHRRFYPREPTYPLDYIDYDMGFHSECDPTLTEAPCTCQGRVVYHYPNWVVHQLKKERLEMTGQLLDAQMKRARDYQQQSERIDTLESELVAARQEIVRVDTLERELLAARQEIAQLRQQLREGLMPSEEHLESGGSGIGPAGSAGNEIVSVTRVL